MNEKNKYDFEADFDFNFTETDAIIERSKPPKEVVVFDRKSEVVDYVPKASSPINYKEAGKAVAFLGGMAGVVYVGYIAIVAFAAWVVSNIAVIGCAGIGCFVLWAFASNKEAGPGEYGSQSGYKPGPSGFNGNIHIENHTHINVQK